MSLKEEERKILVTLELERVDKILNEMEVQQRNCLWGMVANRLYYALFHAVSAFISKSGAIDINFRAMGTRINSIESILS